MKPTFVEISRIIAAPPEKVFEAWTNPQLLTKWWGPAPMVCPQAEVDLREGGDYRLANQSPDGSIVWITGQFRTIQRPDLLVYTWVLDNLPVEETLVRVSFQRVENATEVVIRHERYSTDAVGELHVQGWNRCLDKLAVLMSGTAN